MSLNRYLLRVCRSRRKLFPGHPARKILPSAEDSHVVEGEDVTHVITLAEDISERKKLEESLATNEKLASIGKLAAGIAHEINNPLAAISGCVEGLLLRSKDTTLLQLPTFEDFPDYLRIVDDEISRCKGIINNLLDFSRSRGILQEEIRINETLEQTLQLLSHHKEFKKIRV